MGDIKVLIADDHPIIREGIRNLLDPAVGITVVGEAQDGEQALHMVTDHNPDVLILDMQLPVINGVEVTKRLRKQGSPVRILALSSFDDTQYIAAMLSLGAAGYMIKDEVPQNIVNAVRGVARGEEGWISRQVANKLSAMALNDHASAQDLTPREMDVLRLVVAGKTNAEIGYTLGISEKTVEKHMDGIFTKLEVSSRVEAAVLAVKQQIV